MDSRLGVGALSVGANEMLGDRFNLFEPISTNNDVSKAYKLFYRPIYTTNSKEPFVFDVQSDHDKRTNVKSLSLH